MLINSLHYLLLYLITCNCTLVDLPCLPTLFLSCFQLGLGSGLTGLFQQPGETTTTPATTTGEDGLSTTIGDLPVTDYNNDANYNSYKPPEHHHHSNSMKKHKPENHENGDAEGDGTSSGSDSGTDDSR